MNQPYVRRRFGDVLARRESVQRTPIAVVPETAPEPVAPAADAMEVDRFEFEVPMEAPAASSVASTPSAPAVYHGSLRLHSHGKTSRTGMSVKVEMLDLAFTDINPFKGMKRGREGGVRCRVWFARQDDVDAADDLSLVPEIYKGEAVLLGYQDDHNGTTVLFLLDDGPDGAGRINPFDVYHAAPKDGERLYGAFWALTEQETLQHPAHIRRAKTPFHAKSATQQANILCRNPRFISFLKTHEAYYLDGGFSELDVHDDGPAFAADVLRRHLGIASRSELKDETVVAERARMRWERVLEEFDRNRHGGAWQHV